MGKTIVLWILFDFREFCVLVDNIVKSFKC